MQRLLARRERGRIFWWNFWGVGGGKLHLVLAPVHVASAQQFHIPAMRWQLAEMLARRQATV